jgi:voltage-gated potassium channel Kch
MAMYWTFTTISTTGYGDVVPVAIAERVFAMATMLLGLTVFSYIISSVAKAMEMMHAVSARAAEQRRVCRSFRCCSLQSLFTSSLT